MATGFNTDKQALAAWEEFHSGMLNGVEADSSLTRTEIERRRARLEDDPIEWIRFFFPSYAKYEFAPFQVKAIRRVIEHDEWYEVLSWSRELAKSTVAMFILMYLTLTGRKRFVVLASSTFDSAKRLLAPFKVNLEKNARIRQFYGQQQIPGRWTESEFSCRCGASFIAIGAGSAPRGMRNESIRPDIIYFDDYDTDEDCRNPVTLDKKWDWAEHALYPTRSISEPTLVLWCGNIIAKDCCIVRAGRLANSWDIVNIRGRDGKSSWPQKNTEEQIDRILSKISVKAQQSEYFNNPVAEGKVFRNLPWGKVPPLSRFRFIVGYGDPAYSDNRKKASSTKALVLVGRLKGIYYVIKAYVGRVTNAQFIGWYFDADGYVAGKANAYWYMENNKLQDPFYQQVFKPLLRQECRQQGRQLHIRGDARKKTDKATRIEANLEPIDRNCRWVFNEQEKDNPMMQELVSQFRLFELTMPYPADGPDAVEGAVAITDEKAAESEPVATISYKELNEQNPWRM